MIRKSTWWLMGTALTALVYTMIFEVDRKPPPVEMPEFLPGFNARKVNAVQIEFKGTNILKIVREENRWTLQHPIHYPGMGEGPELLLYVLERLQPTGYVDLGKKGNNPDFASYGLDPPRAVLRFGLTGDPPALELHLGSLTPLEDMVYARTLSQPGLFILPKDFQRAVPMSANFWRDPNLIHLGGNQLEADTISIRSGPRLMTLQHNRTNGTWQVTQPVPIKRGDKARIEQMLVNVWNWQVVGFVSDDPRIDLEQFGLHSPVAELVLGRGTNRLAAVQFGKSPPDQPGFVFARILNYTNVVVVPKPGLDDLRAPVWDFCDHRLADPIGPSELARVEVKAGGNFVLSQSTNGVWRLTAPTSLPADEALVMDLLRNLQLMEALELKRELVADFSQFGLAKPSASYTLRTRGGTNQIHTQITFGNSASDAGDRLYARRWDKDSVYVVANATRQSLPSYSYELRERRIWNFLPNEVTKITIEDGAKATILQRNTAGQWTRPGRQLAANEVRDLKTALSFLGQFQVVDWTTRGADKLAGFDILSRKKSLTLELLRDGQTLHRKIQFGRKSQRQNPYAFATDPLEQEPVVFEFPANTFALCEIGLFPLAMQPPEK
jgi:hypothetical protein